MAQKVVTGAWGTLGSGITNTATTINLTTGHGARFGTFLSTDWMYVSLIKASTNETERVKITARAADVLTVVRGVDDSTAIAFSAGDRIECRPVAVGIYDIARALKGECRLVLSGANIVLQPFNGNRLTFPQQARDAVVPVAGVSLAPTALTPGTLYYIYAVATNNMVSSIEASTTGYAADDSTGVQVKNGDATRVLVGMAVPVTGPIWKDDALARRVASYFNRRPKRLFVADYNQFTRVAGTFATLSSTLSIDLAVWSGESVDVSFSGNASNSANSAAGIVAIGIDSTSSAGDERQYIQSTDREVFHVRQVLELSEGYHSFLAVFAGDGVNTLTVGNVGTVPTVLQAIVWG